MQSKQFFGKEEIWWIVEISATFKDMHLMGQAGPCKNCMDSEEGL